jgi:hypothetical protein
MWHVRHTARGHSDQSYGLFNSFQDACDAIERVGDLEDDWRDEPSCVFDNQLAFYSALSLTKAAGFVDTSYGNDACPSVGLIIECGRELGGSVLELRLWVDNADDQQRECDGAMFTVTISRDSQHVRTYYDGDDIHKATEAAILIGVPEIRRLESLKTYTVGLTFQSTDPKNFCASLSGHRVVEVVSRNEDDAVWEAQATAAAEHAKRNGWEEWTHCRETDDDVLRDELRFESAFLVPHGPFHGQMICATSNLRTIEIWSEEV